MRGSHPATILSTLFHDIVLATEMGQMLDLESYDDEHREVDVSTLKQEFTMDRYNTLAVWKTAYYTFYLPFASALYLRGYTDDEDAAVFEFVQNIATHMGIKFQIDDDFIDFFGDPAVTGIRILLCIVWLYSVCAHAFE